MAELNFNLLTPPGSENIANAFVKGIDQSRLAQREERTGKLQEMQMQQSLRQGQMQELQLRKAQQDEAALNKFYAHVAQNGGPTTALEIEEKMISSGVPDAVKTGLAARMKRLEVEEARKRSLAAFGLTDQPGAAPAAPVAPQQPTAAPGDYLGAGNRLMPPVQSTNALAPQGGPTIANANALTAPQAAAPTDQRQAQITEAKRLMASGDPAAVKAGEKMLEAALKPQPMYSVGNNLVDSGGRVAFTAPAADPARVLEYKFAVEKGYKGSIDDYFGELARKGRAPVQPVAPTITQIQDPTNPNQMITIDARRYTGGGMGSPGVMGASGKAPKAAEQAAKIEKGQSDVSNIVDQLRASYDTLDRMRAIPSTERNVLSNIGSSIQASGVGQLTGRVAGTEAQTERDVIKSSRLQLLNAIKNATGMTAQQLNSNVELKLWLDAVSDPSQSKQAVDRVLENIEKFVGSGGTYSERSKSGKIKPASASAPATTPDAAATRAAADAILKGL